MPETISYLLIGGYAASHAASAIRKRDRTGSIVLLTAENHLPYERPPLSKDLLFNDDFHAEDTYRKPRSYYDEKGIEVRTNARVTAIDRAAKTVTLQNGDALSYENLLLAPGAGVREPKFQGADYANVYYLRKLEHAQQIRGAINRGGQAVVIGGSYLGLEIASGCLKKGLEVTVIDSHDGPWSKFASPGLQKFLIDQYQGAGAKFLFSQRIETINGDGFAQSVQTESDAISCDFVVAAIGSKLNLELAQAADLKLDEKLGIIVDEHYLTSDSSIWAAGDAIHYPDPTVGKMWHNEHYTNAQWSGAIAGANMTGASETLDRVPYFFSDFLDFHMVLRGSPGAGKSQRVIGSMESGEFVELYGDESGVLKMGLGITRDADLSETLAQQLEALVQTKPQISEVNAQEFKV